MLLQIMALTGNVCRNLSAVRQPHTRYLPQSGIRLSWRKRAHRDADTALLRRPVCANRAILKGVEIPVQIRRLALKRLGFPSSPHKLIGCWHCSNLPIHEFQNHFTRKNVLYHLRMTLSTERASELVGFAGVGHSRAQGLNADSVVNCRDLRIRVTGIPRDAIVLAHVATCAWAQLGVFQWGSVVADMAMLCRRFQWERRRGIGPCTERCSTLPGSLLRKGRRNEMNSRCRRGFPNNSSIGVQGTTQAMWS